MKTLAFLISGACLVTCGTPENAPSDRNDRPTSNSTALGFEPLAFNIVDDNLQHDTLLTQVTFDMGDGSFVMVASNVEETFEGLRLYRYRFTPDSTVEMMAISPPAFDSWTMLPTFFPSDTAYTDEDIWILANFGEKESWGQKVLWLDWDFTDMGFMDVALPERVIEDDTLRLKRRNIGPFVRYSENGDTSVFRFACDSVFLYDDKAGNLDQVIASERLRYTFHRDEGLALWLDGHKRSLKNPA